MAKIKYVGRHTAGVYVLGDTFVGHGETVEVDDDVAASLLGQRGEFEAVKSPTKSKATADDDDTTKEA